MKRDLSLMRDILLYIEAIPDGRHIDSSELEFDGKTQAEISHNCALLLDEALIVGNPMDELGNPNFYIERLTSRGHSYLDSIRNDSNWKRVLGEVKKHGGSLPFKIVETLALDLIRKAVLGQ